MTKRMLITDGSTSMMLDKMRQIKYISNDPTGWNISEHASELGWAVTLLTSSTNAVNERDSTINICQYDTFDDLAGLMEREVTEGKYDIIVHSAAVSDYQPNALWQLIGQKKLRRITNIGAPVDTMDAGKPNLFIEMQPTVKLIDCIRQSWGFRGTLVKFKRQVGMSDAELLSVAEYSRQVSKSDVMVANCLEWSSTYAYIINSQGQSERVLQPELAKRLVETIDRGV